MSGLGILLFVIQKRKMKGNLDLQFNKVDASNDSISDSLRNLSFEAVTEKPY